MKDKGLGIAIAFAFIGFVVMYGATDGFSSPDQILIGSSDVTVQQTAPGVTNDIDEGYLPGYVWVDQTGAAVYVTRDTTDGAAIWTDITAGGSTFNSEEADALVTSGVDVIDFGAGFDLTDSPAGETNVLLDYTEDPINLATGEVSGTLATGNGGTGQVANTADAVLVGNGSAFVARVVPDCNVAGSAIGYEDSTDQWSCQSGLGGGSGSVTTLEEGDVQVGGADIVSIDFGPGFDLTESPDTEINIVLDLTEDQVVLTTEVTGTLPAGNGGTGQTAATADGVLVSTGAAFVVQVVPDCDTAGNAIGYDTTTDAWSCFSGYLTTVDISADTNLAAGTGATLTGDTISVDLGTSVDLTTEVTGTLPAGNGGTGQTAATADGVLVSTGAAFVVQVLPDCNVAGSALNYEDSTDAWSCRSGLGGGGSGSVTTLEEGDVQVGGADIVSIDFGPGFDLTESPDTEINIVLDLTEDQVVLTTEVTGTLPAGNGGTGQTAATADGVLVSTGAAFVVQVVPDCDTAGNAIGYDTTTDAWSCFSGYLTTVDISADTNLAAGTNITLTGDTLNVDDAFLLVGGDVGTGSFDFGGADDFEIPNSAGGAAVNAAGEITIDTTSDTLNYHDGTAEKVLQPLRHFGLTLEDPTSAEDISIWHVNFAITIQREMCVVLGSATPSVTVTLRHGTDRNAAGAELNTSGNAITSTTTGNEDVSFNDATIVYLVGINSAIRHRRFADVHMGVSA